MLLGDTIQKYLATNPFQRRKQVLQIISFFIVVTSFQISAIAFTFASALQSQILKAIAFGLTSLSFAILLTVICLFQKQIQDADEEEHQLRTQGIILFMMIIVFLVACLIHSLLDDYHYILCGVNTAIILTSIFMTIFKHPTFRFFARCLSIPMGLFWIEYYFLNVTWGNNTHWGFVIYFGVLALVYIVVGLAIQFDQKRLYISGSIWFSISIYLYFIIAAAIQIWSQSVPWVLLSLLVHISYFLFLIVFIYSLYKAKARPDSLFQLWESSENILKREVNHQQRQNRVTVHECRTCFMQDSVFGFDCGHGFFHICLCEGCVLDHCARFKGICSICGTDHQKIYVFQKHNDRWFAIKEFQFD